MATFLIGIDDTDNATSPGTGQLARRVCKEIVTLGARALGITRHQFLVDPRIPYTGHNRGICISVDWNGSPAALNSAFDLVQQWSAQGSDPGVCVANFNAITPAVIEWGNAAMSEVLTLEDAAILAGNSGLSLRPLGGTGQGIIGALASVGLRAGGQHGRFVDMPGLRELGEQVTPEILTAMGIHLEHAPGDDVTLHNRIVKTLGWVRPRLSEGKAVLTVEWSDEHDAWTPSERKTVHSME